MKMKTIPICCLIKFVHEKQIVSKLEITKTISYKN